MENSYIFSRALGANLIPTIILSNIKMFIGCFN
jgi:hypothetical protein